MLGLAACSSETTGTSAGTTTHAGGSTSSESSAGGGGSATGGQGGSGTSGGTGGTTASVGGGGSGGSTNTGVACSDFAQRYGGGEVADEAQAAGAVVDALGGVIVAGELGGVMNVGGQKLTSAGGKDAFVVRLGAGGAIAWKKRFGAIYDDRVKGLAATPDGGVVVVGTFDGAVDFGGTTLTSIAGPDAFVLRLDGAGQSLFVLQLENADARAVTLGDGGDILVAGDFKGTTTFGGMQLTSAQSDVFVMRVSAAGQVLGAKQYAFESKAGALAIAARAGRTYLTGSFQGTSNFGDGPLVSAGSRDVFLARLDADLEAVFVKRYGDTTSQEARSVTVLSDGSAAIAGSFRGTLDLDGTILVGDTLDDAFVARVDEDGGLVFALRFGDAATQTARSIVADDGDGLLVGGGFQGTINPGDGALVSAGGEDAFVTWLDPQGAAVKTSRWGNELDQRVRSVSVDPCGAVVLGGDFAGSLTFVPVELTAGGTLDVFVTRLAP